MHITNFNELDLTGADQEAITVAAGQFVNAPLVSWSLNGSAFAGGTFTLDKIAFPVFKLLAVVLYKSDSGGGVDLTLTGAAGGDISIHDVAQVPGEAFDVAMYRIVIR
jgi:hypothetical protein